MTPGGLPRVLKRSASYYVMHMSTKVQNGLFLWVLFAVASLLVACAEHPAPETAAEDAPGREAPPCDGCARQGDMKLKMVDSVAWIESAPGYSWNTLPAPIGVLPFLSIHTEAPKSCKICHSFSDDAAEFDFGSRQDSVLSSLDSNHRWTLLVPGLQVPEADSTLLDKWMDSLAHLNFVDQKPLGSWQPWLERGNGGEVMERAVSRELHSLLGRMAARWGVSSLVIPVRLSVQIDPDAGSEGGFRSQVLWTIWDAKIGRLLFLAATNFAYETKGDVPPDRDWSAPYWKWLAGQI